MEYPTNGWKNWVTTEAGQTPACASPDVCASYYFPVSFPPEMFSEGEEAVVEIRPHWTYLSGPVFVFLPSLAVMIAVVLLTPEGWNGVVRAVILALGIAQFVTAAAISGLRFLKWMRTRLIFTNLRVVYWRGSLRPSGIQLDLRKVARLRSFQSAWGQVLGVGDLYIHSVVGGHVRRFSYIPRPKKIQQEVQRLQRRAPEHRQIRSE